MSGMIIPFPQVERSSRGDASSASDAMQFALQIEQSLDRLRQTEELLRLASAALASDDVERMVSVRDMLANSIATRRAARTPATLGKLNVPERPA